MTTDSQPGTPTIQDTERALVLGLGRFGGGREAARFLSRHGVRVRVADKAPVDSLRESVAALADAPGVELCLGREDLALLDDVDLVVANPAIPDHHPLLDAARHRGTRITQEVELFLERYPGRVVLVTGTNGKSTTTMLCAAALQRSGVDVLVGGNIGHSLLAEEPRWSAEQVAVLEISSFQLERLDPVRFPAEAAVFTRVTRDHLDRHGSLEAYHAAKARAARAAHGFVVHAADDPVASRFDVGTAERFVHRRAGPGSGADAWLEDGWLWCAAGGEAVRFLHVDALQLLGAFHAENAMAAAIVAARLGAAHHGAGLGIALTRALPHRLQLAGTVGGIRFYDNGVSTALESTASAIDSLQGDVHWIGGGKSKDGDAIYAQVAEALAGRIATAHVFGAAAPALSRELRNRGVTTSSHERLTRAADAARLAASPGDAVLFSPAFASFDQYPNFRVRAQEFLQWLGQGAASGTPAAAARQLQPSEAGGGSA
jgi:UDP-N-acetylmuramoylalanine--D-glutamate ligase